MREKNTEIKPYILEGENWNMVAALNKNETLIGRSHQLMPGDFITIPLRPFVIAASWPAGEILISSKAAGKGSRPVIRSLADRGQSGVAWKGSWLERGIVRATIRINMKYKALGTWERVWTRKRDAFAGRVKIEVLWSIRSIFLWWYFNLFLCIFILLWLYHNLCCVFRFPSLMP